MNYWYLFLIVAGVVGLVLLLNVLFDQAFLPSSSNRSKGKSRVYLSETIAALDLNGVRQKLATKGWDTFRISAAEHDYRQFLFLIAKHPGETIVPWNNDLDEFWHQHILDTRQYEKDCQRLFGKYIHHNPHIEKTPTQYTTAIDRTAELRQKEFNKSGQSSAQSSCGTAGCAIANYDDGGILLWGAENSNGSDGSDSGSSGGSSCSSSSCSSGGSSCSSGGSSCSSGGSSCGGGGCGGGGD